MSSQLNLLPLLEQYIAQNGAKPKLTVPFLNRKNIYNVELQNWKDYQDLRRGIITIRQSGIRVKSPDYYPCSTHNPVIPIIYENGYRYLNKSELLSLQSFPTSYQFPSNYSLTKVASLLGNSINLTALKNFLADKRLNNLKFIDLFAGIGGFHLGLKNLEGSCILAVDNNKSCAETYQLNFPSTPFLLGDINDKKIQREIYSKEFDLLCAGFPCQPFSRAGKKDGTSLELTSLLAIIKKKQPLYILLESVPYLVRSLGFNSLLKKLLSNYQITMAVLNPANLGIKQNRPRLFIWGKNLKNYV
ncbi:MAG: DNA (cytosine-5-)-methyltransferase [Candidatus Moeniiplasma glomeromycotorum]|nr:DNA (cytosine-5-)-methyltransferase [Candidatus Moeniiplasma glomeromycotorum]MCE8162576.1 DNA (cytosine-5-)-methyltransferase [Candidatus Moeniiplasma glomeromycotorum]MCE8166500.1 DNA (cytosine-5-)-methyltransferase [Candidatus Moeniiplasma glomeromycotorum]MCE8166959.1 DNA (cytosine-5-)-methyltransferase [Candidatus Moeniiplasma glomeromycotorum]